MRNLIFVLFLVVAGVLGFGFYMGWFQFSSGSDDRKASITLSVDKGQLQKDKDKAVSKVQGIGK
jgi:hypothetical protein